MLRTGREERKNLLGERKKEKGRIDWSQVGARVFPSGEKQRKEVSHFP